MRLVTSELVSLNNLATALEVGNQIFTSPAEQRALATTYTNFANGILSYDSPFEKTAVTLIEYFLYHDRDRPIGIGGIYYYGYAHSDESNFSIGWTGVVPSEQRANSATSTASPRFGSQILAHLERTSKRLGAETLSVYTPDDAPEYEGARRFYESQGYGLQKDTFVIEVEVEGIGPVPSTQRVYLKRL